MSAALVLCAGRGRVGCRTGIGVVASARAHVDPVRAAPALMEGRT